MSLPAFSPPDALLPPWDWNPAQTFIDAYNTQRIADQKTEEMRMSNELEKILFPLKVQNAQLQLEKLVQDRDRTMLLNAQIREGRRNASAGINSALSGGSNAPANNQPAVIDTSGFNFRGNLQTPTSSGMIKLPE